MQAIEKIVNCYNLVVDDYATERIDELLRKPFDRLILREFASVNKGRGPLADFGCGPGQTTNFLYTNGVENLTGIDISPAMVEAARKLFPRIRFEIGDILNLSYDANYFGGGLAFYAIVHFSREQIYAAFCEINRVLKMGGQFLFSFHVGSETVHFEKAYEKDIDIDLYSYQPDEMAESAFNAGFEIIDIIERYSYKDVEWATKRAYIWVEKKDKHRKVSLKQFGS